MKKLPALIAAVALTLVGLGVQATPALAASPQPVSACACSHPPIGPSVIESGGALELEVQQFVTVIPNTCVLYILDGQVRSSWGPNATVPFAQAAVGPFLTIAAGSSVYGLNINEGIHPRKARLGLYPAPGGDCAALIARPTLPYYYDSTEWTVNPALSVAPSAAFTTGTAASENLTATLSNPTAGPLNGALASSWSVSVGAVCPTPMLDSVPPTDTYVALPLGLSLDETLSAPGVMPTLTVLGTPAAGTAGDYLVCLTLIDTNGNRAGAVERISVVAGPPVADPDPAILTLAKTGLNAVQDGALAGGAALLALLGTGVFLLIRRRRASV